ncbi:ATP-binding cassette domain-containing protein [Lysinibacillus fusiformis]
MDNLKHYESINVELDQQFITILGQSGCGKTTLLKLLAGLEQPTKGEIRFDDTVIYSSESRKNVKPNKRNIAMVFQDFALWYSYDHLSKYRLWFKGDYSKVRHSSTCRACDALSKNARV